MAKKDNQATKEFYNRRQANHYTDYPVNEDMPLMEFLMKVMQGASRTKVKEVLTQRMVYVDHKITTQYNHPLKKGQLVQIIKRRNIYELRNPYVSVVYEDMFLIVVEKQVGIVTAEPRGSRMNSVKKILNEYVKHKSQSFSVHLVHRLDRETSGLLVFAKSREVQQQFIDNWHDIVTDRRYMAVVEGNVEKNANTIISWLTEGKNFTMESSPVDNGGQQAITHYRVNRRNDKYSLIDLKLDTGRKNQIRVHMKDIGHPIVGDSKYGATEDPLGRIMLHAYKLEFTHPVTREHLKIEIPLPAEYSELI
ncbi:MAG: RluA family pseudouridine synthase [Bacteroidaceae bacterium]|nr:RluA family pseudouridine synthase [Bacteroidaceae bacterium]